MFNQEEFSKRLKLTAEELKMFQKYYQKLIEFNEHTNLTTITEEKDVYFKHFFDSLMINNFIKNKKGHLCDMGSGAGFPSIPLKIINPNLKITIIDSANKRIKFLNELILELDLKDIEVIHNRIEEYGKQNNQIFDYVTARALGSLNLISEYALPMLKINGLFIAMKGQNIQEEITNSKTALNLLGGKIVEISNFNLPYDYGERNNIIIKKNKHISGYPRSYQQILKKPL